MPVRDAILLLSVVGAAAAALGIAGVFAGFFCRRGRAGALCGSVIVGLLSLAFAFFLYMLAAGKNLDVQYEYTTTEIIMLDDGGEV